MPVIETQQKNLSPLGDRFQIDTPELRTEVLSLIPRKPGCYIYRNKKEKVIYVGKSTDLRSRVSSYFQSTEKVARKVRKLVKEIFWIEWVITDNELEALLLEDNLIKHHMPRFNVRLKDDKNYPYIRLNVKDPFPRLTVVRKIEKDGALYFGPYYSIKVLRSTVRLVYRSFKLRRCEKKIDGKAERHCLLGDMGWCSAPCVGSITEAEYEALIKDIRNLLEGRGEKLVIDLTERMYKASDELRFEEAARLRDLIRSIRKVTESQKVVFIDLKDRDVFAVAIKGEVAVISVYIIRKGRIVGRDQRWVQIGEDMEPGSIMEECIRKYYEAQPLIAPEILLSARPDDREQLEVWLREKRGGAVHLRVPSRGKKFQVTRMAERDASSRIEVGEKRGVAFHTHTLQIVQNKLELSKTPTRIEAFDISNIQGVMAVGSMVTFVQGEPAKNLYRRFKVELAEQPNDYAMMQHVIERRLKRREQKGWELPDLMLIDGGKGHLHVVMEACKSENVNELELVALAKIRGSRTAEGFFRPNQATPVTLEEGSPELHLLLRIRDEAHRFAIEYHRRLMRKRNITSSLDEIPGIGKKRRVMLLKAFGSVQRLSEASEEEITAVPGFNRKIAQVIRKFFETVATAELKKPEGRA